jgi:Phage Mu protein F like protein
MRPWNQYKMMPDPTALYGTQGEWDGEVDTILTEIGKIALSAWSQATDVPPVSRNAFIMSQLAQTQNFLVGIPDETYNLVFAEITEVVNGGGSVEQVAQRVDAVLSYTGSERWPGRARTIAQTETTRAYGAGTLAAGLEQSRTTARLLRKKWLAHDDGRTRIAHNEVDNKVQDLGYPFYVGGEALMFPGDPMGSPGNVINCRCSLLIINEEGR